MTHLPSIPSLSGFFTEPEPVPKVVRCCPYCGLEVRGFAVGDCETVDGCREHSIVEGITIEVPWEVFEQGAEAVLAYRAAEVNL